MASDSTCSSLGYLRDNGDTISVFSHPSPNFIQCFYRVFNTAHVSFLKNLTSAATNHVCALSFEVESESTCALFSAR